MAKKPRLTLAIDPEVKAALEQMARERSYRAKVRITPSDLFREAIELYVARASKASIDKQISEDRAKYRAAE